jgi:hypothetical protein
MQEESSRAQDTALTSLRFSTERATICYQFMAKLEASLQQQKAGEKVLRKDVWVAFQEAEAAAKFTTAKGKSGINPAAQMEGEERTEDAGMEQLQKEQNPQEDGVNGE